ncbi:hypothetical protein MMYC01_204647 [Madurella mycetomatis]|uniref:Uncharacterized protein n=1 Tax=Madurella mycetomatis TaxID=100816 RepID=A0A175W4B6_9PEZI|nr:hypothetical protein MMYC01_204647 [Madurella mycetomatis]
MEMLPFTSPLSPIPWSPSPEKRRFYAPFTPSPLNPNTHLDAPRRRESVPKPAPRTASSQSRPQRESRRPPKPAHRTTHYASPTQLLRKKAVAAWRSEALRHHILSLHQNQPQTHLHQEAWEAGPWPLSSQLQERWEWAYNAGADGNGIEKSRQHDAAAAAAAAATTGDALVTIPIPDKLLQDTEDEEDDEDGDIGLLVWPADKRPVAAPSAAGGGGGGGGDQDFQTVDFATLFPSSPAMASASAPTRSVAVTVVPGERRLRLPVRATAKWQRRQGFSRADITMRRVLLVMGLLIVLGLAHGLVRAFGTRPPAVGT